MSKYLFKGVYGMRRKPRYCPGCGCRLNDPAVIILDDHKQAKISRDHIVMCPHVLADAQAGSSETFQELVKYSERTGKIRQYTPEP
jgi:hypothetical protein